jgi:predicted helicase
VAWPRSPDALRPRRPARKKPFPHVREAIKATVKGFEGTDRGQLLMACGTGKTLAAMWITERLGSKRTLILLPSLSLLAQTLREWSANASKPFDYLAVCSDESVAGEDAPGLADLLRSDERRSLRALSHQQPERLRRAH